MQTSYAFSRVGERLSLLTDPQPATDLCDEAVHRASLCLATWLQIRSLRSLNRERHLARMLAFGRIAQRESARFTRERSLVRSQVRPPLDGWQDQWARLAASSRAVLAIIKKRREGRSSLGGTDRDDPPQSDFSFRIAVVTEEPPVGGGSSAIRAAMFGGGRPDRVRPRGAGRMIPLTSNDVPLWACAVLHR